MNRFLKVFALIALITFFASCKNDDDVNIAPPRDYGVQYASDKDSIEKFLKTHYIDLNETTLDATFPEIVDGVTEPSIWDNTDFPLQNIKVTSNEVEYTVYYLTFREGVGDSPTMGDDVSVLYRGTIFDGTQFDYRGVPGLPFQVYALVPGWWDIMPLFKSGVYVEGTDGEPASFTDYGAGAMFLPSGLAYFNSTPSNLVPTYSCMTFTFQLLDVTYTDLDKDGILNKDEADPGKKIEDTDTDLDETPNYLDTDDDGDGRYTKDEIRKPGTTNEYYTFDEIPVCDPVNNPTGPKRHLDPTCK